MSFAQIKARVEASHSERADVREERKRKLWNVLQSQQAEARRVKANEQASKRYKRSKAAYAVETIPRPPPVTTEVMEHDLTLVNDGGKLHRPRGVPHDDTCSNCNGLMHRDVFMSYLVCSKCRHMKLYVDTSIATSASGAAILDRRRHKHPKWLLHYVTFLNAAQSKTTKKFTLKFMNNLCLFCYIEGARSSADINKKLVNRAQRYNGGSTIHTKSILLTALLRGHPMTMPPHLISGLQLLFRKVWPLFLVMKKDLDPMRSNGQAFKFLTRVFLRFLGYDVYLPLIETFSMTETKLKHSSYMRRLCRELGWVWVDGRISEPDITDKMIDDYESSQSE